MQLCHVDQRRASCIVLVLTLAACRRPPADHSPEGTLGLLRASLATGAPPLERAADPSVYVEASALANLVRQQERTGLPLTGPAFAQTMDAARIAHPAAATFAGMLALLGQGHCEKAGDAPLPEALATAPEPGRRWPPAALELQVRVARRLVGAIAGDYRCDHGPAFRAAFVHPAGDAEAWRVAWVGASAVP